MGMFSPEKKKVEKKLNEDIEELSNEEEEDEDSPEKLTID